jgi:endonuclease I
MVAAVVLLLHSVVLAWAQGPNNSGTYYENANGTRGKQLKTALAAIIRSHDELTYKQIWDCYDKTDLRSDGKIWDMYSSTTNFTFRADQAGSYKNEGDVYNREHSLPKSWFSDATPMYTDLMHLVPTDGYVNNKRGNYPFGETDGDEYQSNGGFSKLGKNKTQGYSGTVFEPADEYKGDFARIYFYMVTCYENNVSSWSSPMLDGSAYPSLSEWALKLLLRWAKNDPVSEKEINRNNAVFGIQKNRNPFVDYPGLEQYVWGGMMDATFNYADYDAKSVKYVVDEVPTAAEENKKQEGDGEGEKEQPTNIPVTGKGEYVKVASTADLIIGNQYLIVYENGAGSRALGATNKTYHESVAVSIDGNTTNASDEAHVLTLGGEPGAYTLYDNVEKCYLAYDMAKGSNKHNDLMTSPTNDTDISKWNITFSDGKATIASDVQTNRFIQYNAGSPRFACYVKGQKPVSLYMKKTSAATGIFSVENGNVATIMVDVYSLDGRRVKHGVEKKQALNGLQKGIYIMDGKKYVVR